MIMMNSSIWDHGGRAGGSDDMVVVVVCDMITACGGVVIRVVVVMMVVAQMIVMTRVGEGMGSSRVVGGVVTSATRVGWGKGSVGRSQVGIPVSGGVARIHIV